MMEKLYSGLMSEYALNEEKKRREMIEADLVALMPVKTEEWEERYHCMLCGPQTSFKTKEECFAHAREDKIHRNTWPLSRMSEMMKGESGRAALAAYVEKKNWERRDLLVEEQRTVEKMDLSTDPFFTRDQHERCRCNLCSLAFYNPRDYMLHTLRNWHRTFLAKSKLGSVQQD